MTVILFIVAGLLLFAIGVSTGYEICKKDYKNSRGKVAKMSEHELFMNRHGLKK